MKKLLAPVAAAVLLLTGCGIDEAVPPVPSTSRQQFVHLTGSLRLPAEDGIVKYQIVNDPDTGQATRCNPMDRPGVKDLRPGGTAKIISSLGESLDGEISTGDWDGLHCSMRIKFASVPVGREYYSLFLGHRTETRITDVTVPFELRMGN